MRWHFEIESDIRRASTPPGQIGRGSAHCLSNVGTHRGALVVEGEGHVNGANS